MESPPNPGSTVPRKSLWPLLIRLAVGLLLLALLFRSRADFTNVLRTILSAQPYWLFVAFLLAISGEIFTAYKWRRLLSIIGGHLPILTAIRASYIGIFYNNFLPGSVGGDIARVLLAMRHAGGKARAAASVFMQRNTGLAALFIVGIPAAILWPRHFTWQAIAQVPLIWRNCLPWMLAAALGYAFINLILFSAPIYHKLWRFGRYEATHASSGLIRRTAGSLLHKLQRFHSELHGYRFWLPVPLLISIATQLMDITMVWCLGHALGLPLPMSVLLVTVPMVTLANLIPVTVNGIGLRETIYVSLLASAGISADHAIALSLLQFATIMINSVLGGLFQFATPAPRPEDPHEK